jgi:anthranilate phosphoribosyltransferase
MHAPLFHPAMKNVAPIRKELGVKTFFNMLGPMVNPAFPKKQLVGVFSLELARQYAYLYQNTDKDFVILHSIDGYDEVSLTGPLKYFFNNGERLTTPENMGFTQLDASLLNGGDTVEESAKIFMDVLEGKGTLAQNAAVIANAGMALFAADQCQGLATSFIKASEALTSGKALNAFKKLMEI